MNSPVTVLVLVGTKEQVSSDWNITIHIIATNNGTLNFGVPGMRCMQINKYCKILELVHKVQILLTKL